MNTKQNFGQVLAGVQRVLTLISSLQSKDGIQHDLPKPPLRERVTDGLINIEERLEEGHLQIYTHYLSAEVRHVGGQERIISLFRDIRREIMNAQEAFSVPEAEISDVQISEVVRALHARCLVVAQAHMGMDVKNVHGLKPAQIDQVLKHWRSQKTIAAQPDDDAPQPM